MIEPEQLVDYMKYVINMYPKGSIAEGNYYNEILEDKRLPEEWEYEYIIEELLDEFHADIGLCGCGAPEFTHEVIRQILNIQNDYTERKISYEEAQKKFSELCDSNMKNKNYDGLIQFVLYVLDDKKFLEHGSSIGGSWLTQKGKAYLELLNTHFELINKEK